MSHRPGKLGKQVIKTAHLLMAPQGPKVPALFKAFSRIDVSGP